MKAKTRRDKHAGRETHTQADRKKQKIEYHRWIVSRIEKARRSDTN